MEWQPTITYASFLMRLWIEEHTGEDENMPVWQIEIVSIQTGQTWRFDNLETLPGFLKELAVKGFQ